MTGWYRARNRDSKRRCDSYWTRRVSAGGAAAPGPALAAQDALAALLDELSVPLLLLPPPESLPPLDSPPPPPFLPEP